jgi:hypothetical protein
MSRAGAAIAIGVAVLAIYVLRLDPAAGLYVDDAWYIVLAKALWQGDGFRLISSATTPILPAFPPGFAMLLAPVVGLTADFPANVMALKSVSIIAMGGVGACTYVYLSRFSGVPHYVAIVIAVVTTLLPAFVFLATSTVMSDPVFTLSQVALAIAVERAAATTAPRPRVSIAVSAAIGVALLLVRVAGVAAIAASIGYLCWRRGVRSAITFAIIVLAGYSPWLIYSRANAPSVAERDANGGSVAYRYSELLMMRHGGEPSSGRVTLAELPGRIGRNIVNVLGRDAGAFVFPAAYRDAGESGQEAFVLSGETGMRATSMGSATAILWLSAPISAAILIGFYLTVRRRITVAECMVVLTVAMVVCVPARTYRYVLPLAPFVLLYFFTGVDAIATVGRGGFGAPFRVASAIVLTFLVVEHGRYIEMTRVGPAPMWLQDYEEVKIVTDWMRANLHREGAVATSNPGLVYLTTGRKTLGLTNLRDRWQELQAMGVPYGATLTTAEKPPASLGFPVLFQSPRLKLWVVELPATAGPDRK